MKTKHLNSIEHNAYMNMLRIEVSAHSSRNE